jgi:hypothetical protein
MKWPHEILKGKPAEISRLVVLALAGDGVGDLVQ